MSLPPPPPPPLQSPPPPGKGEPVRYMQQSVKVIRGREAAKISELASDGWELTAERHGPLRTELSFRKARPKSIASKIRSAFYGLTPPARRRVGIAIGVLATVLLIGLVAIVVTGGGGEERGPAASPEKTEAAEKESPKPTPSTTPSPSPSPTPTPAPTPEPEQEATTISVDDLYDKLNAGATEVGDRFKIVGVLSGAEYWGLGASGDFSVLVAAKGGTNDVMIFIDEAQAQNWSNGTKVEFIVEDSKVTIDGETSGGWLRAVSAKVL